MTEPREDDRPEQFKMISGWLHAERERLRAMAQDWYPSPTQDVRDLRSPQLLGATLLALGKPTSPDISEAESVRMQSSLGPLSKRQDLLELRG